MAAEKARSLSGQFLKSEAPDPETFIASWAVVMADFPPIVLDHVCHPAKGLAIQQNWVPTVFEVREACISHMNLLIARWHNERIPEERRLARTPRQFQIEEPREKRKTLEELRAKHGPNWGLSDHDPLRKPHNENYVPPTLGDIINHYKVNKRLGIPLHRPMKEESNGQDHEEGKGVMADALASGGSDREEERPSDRRVEAAADAGFGAASQGARDQDIGDCFDEEGPPPREEGDPGPA